MRTKVVGTLALALIALGVSAVPAKAVPHPGQSVNVMIIDDVDCENGGSFPTTTSGPTGAFTDFTFTLVEPAAVNATALAAVDTVLLNVCSPSPGMNCDVTTLSAAQRTDLVNFMNGGGKLIIYDSECSTQDYSWLPNPFTTSNPGALGGVGTVNIVEQNLLATDNSSDSHFIDETILGQDTDAVGDMNVVTTQDPDVCLHMTGTNAANQTGAAHVYYQSGSGLLIYNGFDIDFMDTSSVPDATTPDGNIAKLWLQELQQPLNGQGLQCAVLVTGISLTPLSATNSTGTSHTVTAIILESGVPQPGHQVTFTVTGTHAGASGTCSPATCITDANGQVAFTYPGTTVGTDQIVACFVPPAPALRQVPGEECSQQATKTWVVPPTPPTTTTPTAVAPTTQAKKKKKCKKGFVRKKGKCVKKQVKAKTEPGFTG